MLRFCTKPRTPFIAFGKRVFSVTQPEMSNISSSSLQEQAEAIQRSIDGAKSRIVEKTEGGVEMSKTISRQLEEDKFIKM